MDEHEVIMETLLQLKEEIQELRKFIMLNTPEWVTSGSPATFGNGLTPIPRGSAVGITRRGGMG